MFKGKGVWTNLAASAQQKRLYRWPQDDWAGAYEYVLHMISMWEGAVPFSVSNAPRNKRLFLAIIGCLHQVQHCTGDMI